VQVSPAVRKILHFVGSNLKLDGLPNLTGLSSLRKGDIVLCRIGSRDYLHLVKSIRVTADGHPIFQIANNHGRINGWTRHVYGKVVKIG
jgi:hypothetical protein